MPATSDLTAEITFLRIVCSDRLDLYKKSKLLSVVDKSHFGFSLTREIYQRILSVLRNDSSIPSMLELMTDPVLSEDARQFIKDRAPRKIKISKTLLRSLRNTLQTYRQIRIMTSVAKNLAETLSLPQSEVNYDKLLENATNKLNEAKLVTVDSETLYHFGLMDNAKGLVNKVLNGVGDTLYPSGFVGFDRPCGGLPDEGLFIIAATTSGGKSTICNLLLKNLYLQSNLSVVKVTLEMSERQETRRLMSCLTKIPHDKFRRSTLSPAEKRYAEKAYMDFKQHGIDNNCRFTIWSPKTCTSLDKILLMVQPYQYNVIAIDYISLLTEDSKDEQWKVLMDLSVRCKAFSRKNKCLVIMLAQLDEDSEKIRYARAIKENADVAWAWAYHKKEHRESRIITVNILKGRDMEVFSFPLLERFDIMSAEDMDADQTNNYYDDRSSNPPQSNPPNTHTSGRKPHDQSEQPKSSRHDDSSSNSRSKPRAASTQSGYNAYGETPAKSGSTAKSTPKTDKKSGYARGQEEGKKYKKRPAKSHQKLESPDYDDGYTDTKDQLSSQDRVRQTKNQGNTGEVYDELDLSSVATIDYNSDGMY